ncbi:MAG: T9SS type A sorting domain-containing protein [Chitinophagales bacterium]
MKRILFLLFITCFGWSKSQQVPLGTWTTQLPYANAVSLCQSNNNIYCATVSGLYSVDKQNSYIEKYTKVNGLSEIESNKIAYDIDNSILIVTYNNSNIDLIQNGKVTNLPFLKDASIIANKTIYNIALSNGFAYMATGFGIVEIDLINKEIKASYLFNTGSSYLKVNDIYIDDNLIYAATENGVYLGNINSSNLLNFNNWQLLNNGISTGSVAAITKFNNQIIIAKDDVLYSYNGTAWNLFLSTPTFYTKDLNTSNNHLHIVQHNNNSSIVRIGTYNGTAFDFNASQFNIAYPLEIVEDQYGKIWHADLYRGLIKHHDLNNSEAIYPNGPANITCKEMAFMNGILYVSSSNIGINWNPVGQNSGFYTAKDLVWTNYNIYNTDLLSNFADISIVQPIPSENKVLFGAHYTGLFEFDVNTKTISPKYYRINNIDKYRLTGSDIDQQGNIFMADAYSSEPILCRKNDGTYTYFRTSFLNGALTKDVVIDDYNQVWIAKNNASGGLVVFNHNNTIDDVSDDRFVNYAAGEDLGNLPTNHVTCMAKDLDGIIWLGTPQGIAIIACAGSAIDYNCPAEQICIDRNDGSGFCDNLLEDQTVTCIAVDAGNRKWIGTNTGLYLVSDDGRTTLHYFTTNNSPLLSNEIRSLAINPDNGEVIIGTSKGINTYRGEALTTSSANDKVMVYPNPVYPNFSGDIAIKGLPNNCQVKITDAAGNLVYETYALGGQAIWNGLLSNGQRAASGVYLILAASDDKKEKVSTKFVFFH